MTLSCVDRIGEFFVPLAREVDRQMGEDRDVEHLALIDNYRRCMGEKWNMLHQMARGDYIATVDDDDMVAPQYVERVMTACRQGRDAVTFDAGFWLDGERVETIRFYPFWIWESREGWCLRPIMHFCPVRREIKLRHPHPNRWRGVDAPQARTMSREPMTVLRIPEELYWYYQRTPNQTHADMQAKADAGKLGKPPLLSILMLSFQGRLETLAGACERLHEQIGNDTRVELLCLYDNQRRSLGEKWNWLCKWARGRFSTFIGDDDEMAPDYVETLLGAIEENPEADAVLFDWEHRDPTSWMHGVYRPRVDARGVVIEPDPETGMMSRIPPDMQCIRHEHRSSVPYPDKWYGEDWPHEVAMTPLLENVVRIPRVLYHKNQDPKNDAHLRMQARADKESR